MFKNDAPLKISESRGAENEPSVLEQLQVRFFAALEEAWQGRRLRILKFKQEGRDRYFFVLNEQSIVEPLKTTLQTRCIRDDVGIYDVSVTYTTIANKGTLEQATFKLIPNPKAVGVDAMEIAKLVNRIIRGLNP